MEGYRHEAEEVVQKGRNEERYELKESYTNVNLLILVQLELNDYLRENIMGIIETKLSDTIMSLEIEKGECNVEERQK